MAKKILIIEDDPDILDMMTYIVQGEGFHVITSMGTVSVAYVQEINPALILLDIRLADGFGRDLCLKLKNDPATRHFPVVLVSAVNQLAQVAEDSNADAYLNKPFDVDELVLLVRKFA
ncbi:response regulator transcription factor [Mucilaginibacter sp.]|uniref:response regulator transcription factor n=1 Tax=Mucilaginibacter sp. TaxID=1882438 RepID=UPI0035BC1B46